jgi:glutamine amidotransferase
MGWNTIESLSSPLFKNIEEGAYLYFVHSYFVELSKYTIAQTCYGKPFAAALQFENFFAVQAHPEKSSETGMQLLKNFIEL